jgi:hypothetical protein
MRTDQDMLPQPVRESRPSSEGSVSIHRDAIKKVAFELLSWCQDNQWAGYDPYDALNSRLFQAIPLLDFKWPRLILTQAMKRSPINLRTLFLVPKMQNPKGLALFLSATVKLRKLRMLADDKLPLHLAENLLALRSTQSQDWCWGYHFDWQSRGLLVPKGYPNIICTTAAGNALLDCYDVAPKTLFLETAVSAAEFLLRELYREEAGDRACFGYTALAHNHVFNANLLGAAFLCRVASATGQKKYITPAIKAARLSVQEQREDGSWVYGEGTTQQWVDNFHTGFNLGALRAISRYSATSEFDSALRLGFKYYREHFFLPDGAPKYYHDRVYPLDVHSAAQSLITLAELRDLGHDNLDLAERVFQWALANLWSGRGYFYYQKFPFFTNRIPYMRWGQAWMLMGLATFLEALDGSAGENHNSAMSMRRDS